MQYSAAFVAHEPAADELPKSVQPALVAEKSPPCANPSVLLVQLAQGCVAAAATVPSTFENVHTPVLIDAWRLLPAVGPAAPDSSLLIAAASVPLVSAVQSAATTVPSTSLYGPVPCARRVAASVVPSLSHALKVPVRAVGVAAAASAWHLASAPSSPPSAPS